MPIPRITGLLHNCALNSALPNLLLGIAELAQLESEGALESIKNDQVYLNYKKLKTVFAGHYGIADPETFSWVSLNRFLTVHSFYGNELIFAPVFRKFIAAIALTQEYLPQDLGALRDVQRDGTYNDLHYLEAAGLFHNQFGITLRAYEFTEDNHTDNARDNYKLLHTKAAALVSPLTASTMVDLFYKDEHFEIQPHETIGEANAAYGREIEQLPQELNEVHDAFSFSFNAYSTNSALGKLLLYVNEKFYDQFQLENKHRLKRDYMVTVEQYSVSGYAFHDVRTYAGRQTFAVILLNLVADHSIAAREILSSLGNLAYAANCDVPLALRLSDRLAAAVIDSKMSLQHTGLQNIMARIREHDQANNILRTLEQPRFGGSRRNRYTQVELKFLKSVDDTIKLAWKAYKETHDETMLNIIWHSERLLLNPTLRNINIYNKLREQASGKGSWAALIAGSMLTVMGLALIVGTALVMAATFGATTPITVPTLGVATAAVATGLADISFGLSFFNHGMDRGLYKQMEEVHERGETYTISRKLF